MSVAERCEHALRRGLDFLQRNQQPSGEFLTLVGPDPDLGPGSRRDPSIFTTVNVATSLLEVDAPGTERIVRRAADFLRAEMLPGGLWRFWTHAHPGSRGMPPDVDDTASVSVFLQRLGAAFPENVRMLLANRNHEGRFWTWITPRLRHVALPQGRSFLARAATRAAASVRYFRSGPEPPLRSGVDCVVNCNTLLYLGDRAETASASAWVADVIRGGQAATSDRWYQSEPALFYAAARCIERGVQSMHPAVEHIRGNARAADHATLTALELALLASTMTMVSGDDSWLTACIDSVLGLQAADGGWPARAFYYDGFGRALSWGSRELTTGFCLEAIGRFLRTMAAA